MNGNPASHEVVGAIITLAHGIKLRAIANGIEQKWQLAVIQSLHCDFAQGYLLGAPVPADVFFKEHINGHR